MIGWFLLGVIGLWVFTQTTMGGLVDIIKTYAGGTEPASAGAPGSHAVTHGKIAATHLVDLLLMQKGEPYVWGGDTPEEGFDCSGLIDWGMSQLGFPDFPGDSASQYAHCRIKKTPAKALHIRGAVLYHPPGFGGDQFGHIALSLGDGKHTIEARGTGYGVTVVSSAGRFSNGALIPELFYGPRLSAGRWAA